MSDPNDTHSRSGYRPIPEQPYPQQPYPPTAYSASGGRHRRLSLVWVGVGLVAAVGIGLGAGALVVPSDQLPTPIGDLRIGAAPRAVAPYHRMAGARANRVTHRVRNAMTASNATSAHLYGDALVAAYALPGSRGPDLLVVANDADNATVVRLLRAGSGDQDRARQFVSAIGAKHVQDYPSAPLSGSLQCGTQGGLDATVCVWFDASTFGYVVDYAADPPKQVAGVTVRMRSATEH